MDPEPAGKFNLRKYPLLRLAVPYSGGVWLADALAPPFYPCLMLCVGFAAAMIIPRLRRWIFWPLLVLAGAVNLSWRTAMVSPTDLRALQGERVEVVTVRGRLLETPSQRVYQPGGKAVQRTLARLKVQALQSAGSDWRPATGRVAVSMPGVLTPDYYGGQTVEISGVLRPPPGPPAEGLFDYRDYLRRQGIYYQLQAGNTGDWRSLSPDNPPPLTDRFNAWAMRTLALGLDSREIEVQLLWAMTLGWKTALNGEVAEPFMRSGTMHVFAVSGLHITLIAAIFVGLLRVTRMPRGLAGVLVIGLVWAYTAATGWQASGVRSAIMSMVILAGWTLNRPSNLLNSLAGAALIILLGDPRQLFQAGFRLSFFVVLNLVLFAPVLNALRAEWLRPDPFLPELLRPWWLRISWRSVDGLAMAVTASLVAWLGSLPLIADYFHLLTPVTLASNVVVVPLSGAALACNLGSLVVGAWFPYGAELLNNSAWLWMRLMIRASEWSAAIPGGAFHVLAPGWLGYLLYYSLLAGLMSRAFFHPQFGRWLAVAASLLALAWGWQRYQHEAGMRLTILPVNGGHAVFYDPPRPGGAMLIDCGDADSASLITKPFLQGQGVNRIAHLVLTHGDQRHVGGIGTIMEGFWLGEAHCSPVRFRSPAYRQAQTNLQQQMKLRNTLQRGAHLGPWTVLHPGEEKPAARADDNSLVLCGNLRGTRVLLLSDLGAPGAQALMARTTDLRADIVIAGLPDIGEPLPDALIEAIQPQLIIIADSEYPAQARAGARLRARLAKRGIQVIYTRETGAATLNLTPGHWDLRTMRPPAPKPDREIPDDHEDQAEPQKQEPERTS